ncbi:MAG: hypothetical protein AAFY42_14560, partial [Pseudomonadota bacterium]
NFLRMTSPDVLKALMMRPMGTQSNELPPFDEQAQGVANAVMAEVKKLGGDGGIILVTPEGDALYSFNTAGMYRGRANSFGLNEVAIFGGEEVAEASNTPDH